MQPPPPAPGEEPRLAYTPAPPSADETARQAALENYQILETETEQSYDDLTALAAAICDTPIALITLLDSKRQWFKSRVGLDTQSTPRAWAFCAHAIHHPAQVMEIPNALEDPRFAENPLVQGALHIRFYAGAPLVTPAGVPVGTLCVIDYKPRQLTPQQTEALQCLARQTIAQFELRVALRQIKQQAEKDAILHAETRRAYEAVERKNKELAESRAAALRASQVKSDFLSTMSHEIRTPMNGVLGMTQILAATSLSPEQRHYVEIVQSSGRTLLALIDDLLDLSKIEAGKVTIESIDFDLRHLVTEITEMWSIHAKAKGLAFDSNIAAGVPQWLRGDSNRLRQVLNNLVNNAIKFTAHGEVGIRVELADQQEQQAAVRFSVADTGIGIRPDQRSILFSPFVQADVSTTRNYGGTGLGLSICKHLVELMGGTIGIHSQAGKGSIFCFTLSFPISECSTLLGESEIASQAESRASLRILIAEDNQINRLVIVTQLNKLGHQTDVVSNGLEAVKKATAEDYDMLLMDCDMPGMDGYEATSRIRRVRQGHLPIIAVTAKAMSGDRDRCLRAGMDDFLSKPIDMQLLSRMLARWCPPKERGQAQS